MVFLTATLLLDFHVGVAAAGPLEDGKAAGFRGNQTPECAEELQ